MDVKNKTILLVEDHAIIALDESEKLKRGGYRVVTAMSGEAAVEKVRSGEHIDLILMDLDLGKGMDGTQTAEIILKDYDIPIVFLSSHSEPEVVDKTDKITSYGYITKSTESTVFFASLKMAFRLYETKRELIKREETLKASEERFRSIFNNAPFGIFHSTTEGKLINVNATFAKIMGYDSPEEIKELVNRKNVAEVLYEEKDKRPVIVENTLKADCWQVFENRYRRKDGKIIIALLYLRPYRRPGSTITELEGFIEDITERKRAEEALNENRTFLNAIVENIPDMIFVKEADALRYTWINKAGEELLGYAQEELEGKNDYDLFPHDEADFFIAKDREVLSNMQLADIPEEPVRTRKRGERILHTKKIPLSYETSSDKRFLLGISEDITERRTAEKALAKTLEEKDALFRELQHRVKNSFAIIAGLVGLERDRAEEGTLKTVLRNVESRIQSIQNLFEQLYHTQNISELRLDTYLHRLCQSLIASYAHDTDTVRFDIALEPITLDIKRSVPVGLIVNELVTNALKYAFPDRRKGTLAVRLSRKGEYGILEVSDNGVGLPENVLTGDPSGLGMMLVRMLTQQLSGAIEQLPTCGTTFRITIPRIDQR